MPLGQVERTERVLDTGAERRHVSNGEHAETDCGKTDADPQHPRPWTSGRNREGET